MIFNMEGARPGPTDRGPHPLPQLMCLLQGTGILHDLFTKPDMHIGYVTLTSYDSERPGVNNQLGQMSPFLRVNNQENKNPSLTVK